MTYKGKFKSVISVPGDVYAIDYIPDIRAIAAVNISSSDAPSKVSLVNPDTGVLFQSYLVGSINSIMK